MLESSEILCALSLPVTEATDSGLKALVGLMVKCSSLELPGCCSSTTRYEVCGPLGYYCSLGTTWLCYASLMTWLAGIWVSGIVKMYFLAVAAGCCGCCS